LIRADHIAHRVRRNGQIATAARIACAIEMTTAHCHHGHVVQVAALPPPRPLLIPQHEPLPIVLDWQAPYRYQFMGVRVAGMSPLALTVKP